MATKIRLQRHGRGKRPFYTIVISDSRARRDGKYIERIGDYNPLSSPAVINVDVEKAVDWLMKGAEPTATVNAILKYKGALHRKHLLRGVAKGALTQEVADQKWTSWQEEHKNSVLDHQRKLHKSKEDRIAKMLEDEAKINREREEKRKAALAAAAAPEVSEEAPVIAEEVPVDAPAETQEATETTETDPAE